MKLVMIIKSSADNLSQIGVHYAGLIKQLDAVASGESGGAIFCFPRAFDVELLQVSEDGVEELRSVEVRYIDTAGNRVR